MWTRPHSFIPEQVWSSSHRPTLCNTCTQTRTSCAPPRVYSSALKLCSPAPPLVSPLTPPSTRPRWGGGRPSISGSSSGTSPERSTRSGCREWPPPSRSPGKNPGSCRCRTSRHHKWPKRRKETNLESFTQLYSWMWASNHAYALYCLTPMTIDSIMVRNTDFQAGFLRHFKLICTVCLWSMHKCECVQWDKTGWSQNRKNSEEVLVLFLLGLE